MLVTRESARRNQHHAIVLALGIALVFAVMAMLVSPWWLAGWILAITAYVWWRRSVVRRSRVLAEPFRKDWFVLLKQEVDFFRALDDPGKTRFCNLIKVFLDEVRITGIRTDVDDTTRLLVAASAVIPIYGFDDWEYSGLGEVLIYPDSFNADYQSEDAAGRNTLGMIGVNHLSGVMILSKPALLAGFRNSKDRRNVGVHEFAHLVDKRDGSVDGLAATIAPDVIEPWVSWVGNEMRSAGKSDATIDDYAYTNEAEYFAVLSEYFFESPSLLQQKNPKLYAMMRKIYHQNPKSLLAGLPVRRGRVPRNSRCPCGSGRKYKQCCRKK